MRDKCELEYPRCRICLDNLVDGQTHNCSNIFRCAQCKGDHHSLSNVCEKVSAYRSELKEQVDNAISTGKLHRAVPQDRVQPVQFQMKQNEFPPPSSLMTSTNAWRLASTQVPITTSMNVDASVDTTKILLSINQNILDMKESTHSINEKVDRINDKINQTALDTELHHETLMKVLPTITSIIEDFIWPIMHHDVAGLRHKKDQLQALFTSLSSSLKYLKTDYTARRKRSTSPPPNLPSSNQPAKTAPNNETIKNE